MSSPPTYALRTKGVSVSLGNRQILSDVSIDVPRGTILGLLGPSGSGKTTLMRSIVGLQRISSGQIELLGMRIGSPEIRDHIGYSTQSASIYSDLTCLENVDYFAALHSHKSKSPEEILAIVDLSANTHQMAGTLSGGERSRLSLATTLVGDPHILILDEPTVGLDPLLRLQLWKLFDQLASDGMTLIISSHVMEEADNCHQLILMRDGRVLAQGTPGQLKDQTGEEMMEKVFIALTNGESR